jgi:hypothetical protein
MQAVGEPDTLRKGRELAAMSVLLLPQKLQSGEPGGFSSTRGSRQCRGSRSCNGKSPWWTFNAKFASQRLPAPDHHCVGRAVEEFVGAELEQNGAPSRSGVLLALTK